jgi:hypothetical protein
MATAARTEVHLQADEEEQHAVHAEGGHLPRRADGHLPVGVTALPAHGAQGEARRHHGQHGGDVQRLGEERGAVRGEPVSMISIRWSSVPRMRWATALPRPRPHVRPTPVT